jgi:hypothetical protein
MTIQMGLARLAGARTDLLKQAPGDLTKQSAMGGVLLSTAGVATVSAYFGMNSTLHLSWPVSLAVGLCWGTVILNLDRMLIISMSGLRTTRLKIAAAAPRLLLALVIGTVISTPLVLRIFQHEIDAQIIVVQAQGVQATEQTLTDAYARVDQLTKQQSRLEAVIAGTTIPSVANDPDVVAATKAYQDAQATYQQLNHSALCEFDGSCGTGHVGDGPSYKTKVAAAQNALQASNQAKQHLDAVTSAVAKRIQGSASQSADQARQQLPAVQRELVADRNSRDALEKESLQAQQNNDGLLPQLEALEQITSEHPAAWWAHTMLFLLFVSIELLPVITKILIGFGDQPLYERLAQRQDETADELDRIRADGERDVTVNTASARTAIAQQQLDDQVEAGKEAAKAVVREQSAITLKAIEVWAELARLRADEELRGWYEDNIGGLGTPAPPAVPTTTIPWPPTTGSTPGQGGNASAATIPNLTPGNGSNGNGWHNQGTNGSTS